MPDYQASCQIMAASLHDVTFHSTPEADMYRWQVRHDCSVFALRKRSVGYIFMLRARGILEDGTLYAGAILQGIADNKHSH